MEFADPATVDVLNAEVVAFMERNGVDAQDAIEIVRIRRRVRRVRTIDERGLVELCQAPDGRFVIIWWERLAHAQDVKSGADYKAAGVGFDCRMPTVSRMEFADPATINALNAEVVALIAERGCNGKDAMEIVLHRRGMRCIVPAEGDAGAELWRLPPPDGRFVTVWWESQYGQARAVTDPTAWEDAAVGFDNQELLWEEKLEELERRASEDV